MEGVEQSENLQMQGHKRYEASFKKGLYLKVIADVLYILIDLLVIFLPIFEVEFLGFAEGFSFYDEIKNIIKNFSFSNMFSVYFLAIAVPIIVAQIVRLAKDVSSLFSIEVYVIENYKRIKNCVSDKKQKKHAYFLGVTIFAVILLAAYGSRWLYENVFSSFGEEEISSYFAYFNRLASIFYLLVVVVVVSAVLDAFEMYYHSALKKKILLENQEGL